MDPNWDDEESTEEADVDADMDISVVHQAVTFVATKRSFKHMSDEDISVFVDLALAQLIHTASCNILDHRHKEQAQKTLMASFQDVFRGQPQELLDELAEIRGETPTLKREEAPSDEEDW